MAASGLFFTAIRFPDQFLFILQRSLVPAVSGHPVHVSVADGIVKRGDDSVLPGQEVGTCQVGCDRVMSDKRTVNGQDSYETDITSPASAAAGMNRMKQEILFYRRAYEDSSQNALWRYMLEYFVRRYTELVKKSWAPIFSIPSLLTVFGFIVWALSA